MKASPDQTNLFGLPTGRVDSAPARAISFFGFVLEPYEGRFHEVALDGCETIALGNGRFLVTLTGSLQTIAEGDVGTIDHRYLENRDQRYRLEERLHRFCDRQGIAWRSPHWRLACRAAVLPDKETDHEHD